MRCEVSDVRCDASRATHSLFPLHDLHLLSRDLLLSPPTFPGFGSLRSLIKVQSSAARRHVNKFCGSNRIILLFCFCFQSPLVDISYCITISLSQGFPLALSLAVAILIPSPSTSSLYSPLSSSTMFHSPHSSRAAVTIFGGGVAAPALLFVTPRACAYVRSAAAALLEQSSAASAESSAAHLLPTSTNRSRFLAFLFALALTAGKPTWGGQAVRKDYVVVVVVLHASTLCRCCSHKFHRRRRDAEEVLATNHSY